MAAHFAGQDDVTFDQGIAMSQHGGLLTDLGGDHFLDHSLSLDAGQDASG